MLEKYLIKPLVTFLARFFFRIKIVGLENYHAAGDKVVIACNHQSYLDPMFLTVFLPEKPAFAMNIHQASKWYFRWVESVVRIYKIDPLAPMSLKRLITDLRKGTRLVIFPEGRITTTSGIMKIYDGTSLIIEKTGATLLPVHVSGAEYSKLSRLGKKLRTRLFPQVTITILPPVKFKEEEKISSLMIYDTLTTASFAASNYKKNLMAAILEAAQKHGDRHSIATDITRQYLNYRQLFTRAFILKEKLNGQISDHKYVGVLLPNSLGALVTFVALQVMGKIPAMLNFSAGEKNILHACNISTVKTVLTSRTFIQKGKLEHIAEALEKNYKIIYLEDIRPNVTIVDKLSALTKAIFAKESLSEVIKQTDPKSPAVILFTSGSEGVPKGVALSHINILANINQSCAALDLTTSDILFNAMPVFHSFGLTVGMLLPLLRGVNMFLYPSPLHYRIIPELAYDSDATVILGTDTFFQGYARYAHPYDFYNIRLAVAGAEKLKETTRHLYADKFNVNIMQGYGVTETSPVISFNTLIEHKVGSVGRAFPGIECRLEPVSGLENGGRLQVKGDNVMLGYIKADNPGVIQAQEEWYDTGDIVEIDDKGFITIVGRAKRFAKIGGEMISLTICEELASHLFPDCAHAAVTSPDDKKGEQIILYSECADISRESLLEIACSKGVPEIAIPKHIRHIPEIPRLGSGKIDYPELARKLSS